MFIKFFTNLKPNPALQQLTQDELTKMRAEVTPSNLKVDLLDHQVRGVHWMMTQEKSDARGGILADDMGLGKTLQTICLLLNHRPSKKTRLPTLIVLPVSLINQWQKEIRNKTQRGLNSKTLSIFIHHGKTKAKTSKKFVNYDIVLTTYNQVAEEFAPKVKERKNSKERSEKRVRTIHGPLHRTTFYRVVLDEAQYIKNEKAKSSRGCCNLKAKYRWCLSGTPLQNNTAEAYSLIKFLRAKPYYYYNLFQAHIDSYAKGSMQSEIGLKRLHLFLQTIMLRRTKTSQLLGKPLLELPARNIHEVKVQFSEYEREAYDSLASKCIEKFKYLLKSNEIRSNFTYILVLLLRMRQACCHLKLVHDAIKNTDNDDLNEWNDDSVILQQQADKDLGLDEENSIATSSAKVKALITKLNEIHEANAKSKVIIFSQVKIINLKVTYKNTNFNFLVHKNAGHCRK
jgi:SNF2 family DNA or RNA helicase